MALFKDMIRLLGRQARRANDHPRDEGPVDAIVRLLGAGVSEDRDNVEVTLSREEQTRRRRSSRRTGDRQG